MEPHLKYSQGKYMLFFDEGKVDEFEEIALCLDTSIPEWGLVKYGDKEKVERWHRKTCEIAKKQNIPEIMEDLVVISGKFPVEELNKCVSITGYAKRMCEKLNIDITNKKGGNQ